MFRITVILGAVLATWATCVTTFAGDPEVEIDSNFPGGNIEIVEKHGGLVQLKPRLDGGRDWFYWCFAATAKNPGKVEFQFPPALANHKNGAVGFQGPAVSYDDGATWDWMGTDSAIVQGRSFSYTFEKAGETVRFSSTIPYLQPEFDAFAERHKANPHFKMSMLNRTPKGRHVELVQIGEPHSDATPVLFTCRHHAGETIASFFLEGFMDSALSDSPEGNAFREKYVLYVVPFVDKDGCEDGDQGKGRTPHDHNRDYGPTPPIYPTVQAVMQLGKEASIRAAIDFHCPTLVYSDHQVIYFVGGKEHPIGNLAKVTELADHMKSEFPEGGPTGPMVWLEDWSDDRAALCSGYFAGQPGCEIAATIEIPFAPKGAVMTPDAVRSYGAAMLRAWNDTQIVTSHSK